MNIEDIREYCICKKAVTESFPFDENTLVFKVAGKMFALTNITGDLRINLKCNPEKAIELRERYSSILPGYHMNKKHWNTVKITTELTDKFIKEMITESYNLVVATLSKKQQTELHKIN